MDTLSLIVTLGAIGAAFGYGYWKDRRTPIEPEEDRLFRYYRPKIPDENRLSLYPASQFEEPWIRMAYVRYVLRGGHPYAEPWYGTMVGVLALLDEFRTRTFPHPFPVVIELSEEEIAITTIDLIGITLDTVELVNPRNNPHLLLAIWLSYIGIFEEFREIPEGAFKVKDGVSVPLRRILTVANYKLVDLNDHDRLTIVYMIKQFWEGTSEFVTIHEALDYAKTKGRFDSDVMMPNRPQSVTQYPVLYFPTRFAKTFDTLSNHMKS